MKTKFNRFIAGILLSAILFSSTSLSALAWTIEGDGVSAKKNATTFSQTLYLQGLNNPSTGRGRLSIKGIPASSFKKISLSLKDTKNIITINSFRVSPHWDEEKNILEADKKDFELYIGGIKPGKATLSLKVGKKTFTGNINILKYTNPLKVAKDNSKSFVSEYKTGNGYYSKWKSAKKTYKGKLQFKTNKNWYFISADVSVIKDGQRINGETYTYKKANSVSIPYKNISGDSTYMVHLYLYNAATKGAQIIYYNVYPANN